MAIADSTSGQPAATCGDTFPAGNKGLAGLSRGGEACAASTPLVQRESVVCGNSLDDEMAQIWFK